MTDTPARKPSRWYERLLNLAELHGDHDQQEIARAIGVSKGTVSNWKQGTPPTAQSVIAAARHYGVEPLELLRIAYDLDVPSECRKRPIKPRQPL
jgi:transcriptional regulator with XRE-family HTH domain